MDYGLMGFGSSLGDPVAVEDVVEEYTEDVERIREYGYRRIHRSAPDVGLTDLAADAALAALKDAHVDPRDLDLVVLAITDIPEYLYWDAAAALQSRIGADRAEAVLLSQGCVGGLTCFDQVAGHFAIRSGHQRALIVGANRTCEAYWNRMDTHSLLFSDGAAAAVAGRDHPRLRRRAGEVMSDGRFADLFAMDQGGAAEPFLGGEAPPPARDAWDLMEFFDYDDQRFEEFTDLLTDRVREVVARACARAGVSIGDLARVVLLNDNAATLTTVADKLGVPLARTNAGFSRDHGHFGAADHLLNLQHLHETDALHDGDVIALAGMGRGMHWGCTVVEA
ncbi:3-oxoacyl-ACP synthase III family protein [Streptomyces sp. WAC 04229]|uniref:3-oxoacyl-ACP synthase III family protein n=1 Tax=Streptomyces sp. WAC 04229 TaxID=2203206 RepID=UPI003D75C1B1